MNILVVDDEKEIADVIDPYLQNDQYSVYILCTFLDFTSPAMLYYCNLGHFSDTKRTGCNLPFLKY